MATFASGWPHTAHTNITVITLALPPPLQPTPCALRPRLTLNTRTSASEGMSTALCLVDWSSLCLAD